MKVYVVMGNDFPDAVFATEAAAEAYCVKRRAEAEDFKAGVGYVARIYWRVYAFDLQT